MTQSKKSTKKSLVEEVDIEELRRAYEELLLLDEMKSNILSNVSHELRTPITVAKAALELMQDEDDESVKDHLLIKALDALTHQNIIIDDLIETGRIISKKSKLKHKFFDLTDILNYLLGEFKSRIKQKKISLKLDIQDDLPSIKADEKMITHALRNLLDNAVKFNEMGGRIIIRVYQKKGNIKVRIKDTGIGIPKEIIDRIFDRFYQIDSSPNRRFSGTGMGLSIVKDIMEIHGGSISVKSKQGVGSEFTLKLPIPDLR